MLASRNYLLISILAVVSGAPKTRSTKSNTPTWYLPCGENLEIDVNSEEEANTNIDVKPYIQKIQIQHKLTLNEYLRQDYEYLYEKVRIGVNEHQYIPNWVPGKKDVNAIRRIKSILNSQMIVNHFPKLHIDLQKFAIAFEELVEDETNPKIYKALRATQIAIKTMLCEVEITIMDLPYLQIPSRVERSIMSNTEREPVDETRRLVRDWGILLKYRDYLHAWKHILDY